MEKLSESQIAARVEALKGWSRVGDMLVRSWQFASAHRALEFVTTVAKLCDQRGHHPDIVLSYREVRVELSTHQVGGVTDADFALASAIDAIPAER